MTCINNKVKIKLYTYITRECVQTEIAGNKIGNNEVPWETISLINCGKYKYTDVREISCNYRTGWNWLIVWPTLVLQECLNCGIRPPSV